jgi:hypothetical protein
MSEKQTTFFTVNCAGKIESTNQCELLHCFSSVSSFLPLVQAFCKHKIPAVLHRYLFTDGCLSLQ